VQETMRQSNEWFGFQDRDPLHYRGDNSSASLDSPSHEYICLDRKLETSDEVVKRCDLQFVSRFVPIQKLSSEFLNMIRHIKIREVIVTGNVGSANKTGPP
jgi:hypothetical protein